MSVNEKMGAIARAIRSITGKKELLTLDGIASAVDEVYDKGEATGYLQGHHEGVIEGKIEGHQAANEYFWEQMSAVLRERSAYSFGGRGWNNYNFRPPYPIRFYENAKFVLRNTRIEGDVRSLATIDFSMCTSMEYAFSGNHWLTAIGKVDASSCKTQNAAYYFGCDNRYLETVEEFVSIPVLSWDGIFANCPKLREIRVSGVIDSNKVNFSQSPALSIESIESILTACSGNVQTITFSYDNILDTFGGEESFKEWVNERRPNLSVVLI